MDGLGIELANAQVHRRYGNRLLSLKHFPTINLV